MQFRDQNLFSIDPGHIRRIRLAVGLIMLIAAASNFFFPAPDSLSTGRWSWVYLMVTNAFGPNGYAAVQALIGIVCVVWSRQQSAQS